MTDQELRDMIRESIGRHLGAAPAGRCAPAEAPGRTHASHGLLPLSRGGDGDGACLIEPAVPCNRCSFCLSLGH
jgi:hypothetical protein